MHPATQDLAMSASAFRLAGKQLQSALSRGEWNANSRRLAAEIQSGVKANLDGIEYLERLAKISLEKQAL